MDIVQGRAATEAAAAAEAFPNDVAVAPPPVVTLEVKVEAGLWCSINSDGAGVRRLLLSHSSSSSIRRRLQRYCHAAIYITAGMYVCMI